ncbi:MAG: type II toxin-antitoxin system RelE/ParE family toxin [Anaerolineae bacterium]|nr:type II toxin-antitoxin system RelE/ParE family toxin [Anaerolineae bacterium]
MSRYTVYVTPPAWKEIKTLPGHMRQRVKQVIDRLVDDPRPHNSVVLRAPEDERELWRLRLDRWRIVYAVTEAEKMVDILAVRKRPPYDYGDLEELLGVL